MVIIDDTSDVSGCWGFTQCINLLFNEPTQILLSITARDYTLLNEFTLKSDSRYSSTIDSR